MSLDMKLWRELIATFEITEPMIPHREEEYPSVRLTSDTQSGNSTESEDEDAMEVEDAEVEDADADDAAD